jgi:hypothetical protein
MKKRLLNRKRLMQLALSLCLILVSANLSWGQQTIGSFPYMDGGFEAQNTGLLGSTVTAGSWIRLTATNGASTINTTGARTGAKFANATYTVTTSNNRILQSPNSPSTASTDWPTAASHTVQFWIKNSTGASIPVGVGSTGGNYISPTIATNSGTWTMYTQTVTAASASQAASYAAVRIQNAAANFDIDDFVVYLGAADSTPPTAATAAVTPVAGTTVSWTAASGGVDGGGYMVVRYASNPNIDQDPNQNGIYAKNLSITNGTNGVSNPGTVVYIGTGTSFTDDVAGSSSGTDYYKIYTVDKAFNYSAELIATAVVSSTPAITSSTETLTGFNYTGTGPSASQSFVVTGSNLTANLVVSTASTNFELSSDDFATAGAASITLTGTTVASTTISVRLKANLTDGLKTATVNIASTGANTLNSISLSGSVQAVYYYDGSGLLSSNTSWGANSNGTGANPTAVTDPYTNFVIANGNATTNDSWTLGSNSKVIVGNVSPVTLTVADTFPITGTIDANTNGSVVWQHVLASPTFGTLDNNSEVHFAPAVAASYSFGATTAYGKLFIDGAGEVSVSNTASTPSVKTALTVASGSTLSFSSNNNPSISINSTATATINGKVITFKATGLFVAGGSIPLIGSATLVLGATSTIEFGRPGSAQTVTGLPSGVSYANLTLSGLDSNKSLSGNTTVTGVFRVNGTGTSTFTTGSFDLTLGSNASAVFGPQAVLNITGGTTNFNSRPVTLQSSVNGTARIGNITGNIIGATNVTVERYIPAKRAWRALTAPVSTTGSIYTNWQEGGTGNLVNGFDIWMPGGINGLTAGGSSNSLLEYNSADNAWTGITATNGSSSMMNGDKNKPFMAFVTGPYGTGNITSNSAATTLRATGSLIIGQQTYTTVANKYTFIGNPYASPLSLSSMITSNNASFEGNIWIWDANTSVSNPVGIYNLYNNGTYTNVTNTPVASTTEIQSGQAFFVRSTSGDSFIIQESNKGTTNSAANIVFRDAAPAQLLRVGLYKQENTEWSGRDGAMTVILPDANANQTPNKMANGTENVAFTKNGLLFASNHHLPLVANDVLNVKVWNTTAGANYKLKINTEAFTATNLSAILEDLFTNATTPLTLDGSAVEYPFTVTNDALSTGDRFRIVFQNAVLGTINPTATSFSIFPNPVIGDSFQVNLGTLAKGTYSYSICNTIGQEVAKGTLNNATQNTNYEVKMTSAATGIYIMKINGSDNSVFTAKIIKK